MGGYGSVGTNNSTIVSKGGVRVRKSIVVDGTSASMVKFAIESNRDQPVAIRICERLPEMFEPSAIDFDDEHTENEWQTVSDQLVFSRVLAPNDSLVTAFAVRDSEYDLRWSIDTPVLDTVQPVDPEVLANGETVPQWRGNASAIRSNGHAVSTSDHSGSMTLGRDLEPRAEEKSSLRCLVAIPAYNEGNAIAGVVKRTKEHADHVLVIDDGSEDETASEARDAGADVVQHEHNRGYGGALKTAFQEANRRDADCLVVIDGDGQHDAADVSRLVNRQQVTGAEIVIGSRFAGDHGSAIPLYRRFGLRVVNFMTNLSMGNVRSASGVRDTQSGFRAYSRTAIRSLANDDTIGDHMHASTDILYHARRHSYDIEEIGTRIRYDVENGSTHNPLSHGIVLISNILHVIERERPIASLGVPGFTSVFIGIGFFYWAISNYIQSGAFSAGLTMVAVFFTLAGVFACFTAIMLHALNQFTVSRT